MEYWVGKNLLYDIYGFLFSGSVCFFFWEKIRYFIKDYVDDNKKVPSSTQHVLLSEDESQYCAENTRMVLTSVGVMVAR